MLSNDSYFSHPILVEVRMSDHDSSDQIIRKFLKKFKKSGVMEEIKKKRFYSKPSDKKRIKIRENIKRLKRMERKSRERNKLN